MYITLECRWKSVCQKEVGRNSMSIKIDGELCTGCGLCEETCPDIFKLNEDDDIAELVKTDYDEDDEECIEEAIESCPTEAITTG